MRAVDVRLYDRNNGRWFVSVKFDNGEWDDHSFEFDARSARRFFVGTHSAMKMGLEVPRVRS